MTYNELLKQKSWYEKCVEILHRDKYRCQKCGTLGFHNNTYYECQTVDELDSLLKGILIANDKPSAFFDKIRKSTGLGDFNISHYKKTYTTDGQFVRGKYLTDLTISWGDWGILSWIILTASKNRIQDTKCKGSFVNIDRKTVIIPPEMNLQYSTGCYFIFDNSYFDKPIVRIEKRITEPMGIAAIIICICYQECGISLEFMDKSVFDANGNYLETPITPNALNVHHKYYVNGKNPWEYDDDALITLCQDCHCLEHKSTHTPVYRDLYNKQVLRYAEICDRCGGSGYLPQYRHRDNGICKQCHGEGVLVDQSDAEADFCHNTNEH